VASTIRNAITDGQLPGFSVSLYEAGTAVDRGHSFRELGVTICKAKAQTANGERVVSSAGRGDCADARLVTAVMECVERKVVFEATSDRFASLLDLGSTAVDPRRVQMGLAPRPSTLAFAPATAIDWSAATHLPSGAKRWFPRPIRGGNPGFFVHTTNGCAVAGTRPNAILSGLLELLERDALMLGWYARQLPTRELLPDEPLFESLGWLEHLGLHTRMFELHSGAQATAKAVLAVAVQTQHDLPVVKGGVVVGAACDLTCVRAAGRAISEVIQAVEVILSTDPQYARANAESAIDYYARHDRRAIFDWLLDAPLPVVRLGRRGVRFDARMPHDLVPDALDALVDDLARAKLEPFVVERRSAVLSALGVHMVEVAVPGLFPLVLGLDAAGAQMDCPMLRRFTNQPNPHPHPLG
jgi:ribosomal protein S12 methylthiotransferase accessory factor